MGSHLRAGTFSGPRNKSRYKIRRNIRRDAEITAALVRNQGFVRDDLMNYWREHGGLPSLDWPLLAALSAIAGAGMLTNALFSNYARDKGWGMGAQTGAIPSAIGGHRIAQSHVGKVFRVNDQSLVEWRGWFLRATGFSVG
jgi:hypothetical protein